VPPPGDTAIIEKRPNAARPPGEGELTDRTRARIRPYRRGDLDVLYRICLLTGDAGQDATSLFHHPRLLGHIFAAPYGLFEPSLAFVAEDVSGVGGYIVGALDSRAFEQRLESDWWPGLRTRYPETPPGLSAERWTPDQHLVSMIHHPGPPRPSWPGATRRTCTSTCCRGCRPAGMGAS
jgi:hypothetical protein